MTTNPIERLKLGGKAAVIATLMATASFAQTAPADAPAEAVTTMDEVQFPALEAWETDQQVIDSLSAQGYENVVVLRGDDALTVTGERGGLPTELVFDSETGVLLLADGVAPADADAAPVEDTVLDGTAPAAASTSARDTPPAPGQGTNFSGQDQVPLDTPTASIEGDETDPVAETIPADATAPVADPDQGLEGAAETD